MPLQLATEEVMQSLDAQQSGAKERLIVEFFMGATHLPDESAKAGRPIFKDEEYIKISIPGDRDQIVRPVRGASSLGPADSDRFPTLYQAFKNNQAAPTQGTPLSTLPFVTASQAAELAAVKIHTAEQLVVVPDALSSKIMGFQSLRKRVQQFLDAAANAAPSEMLHAELKKRDAEIEMMKNTISQMGKKLDERK
jgi:hypothetical protein